MEKEEGRIPPRPIEARGLLRQIFDEPLPLSLRLKAGVSDLHCIKPQ
jgi:hypothetical protein